MSFANFGTLGTQLALKIMAKNGVKKQTIKPTFGEFEFETDKRDFVRRYFFLTIKNECSGVLEELQGEPLKFYRKEIKTYNQINNLLFQKNHPLYAEAKLFNHYLQTWRGKWKLKSPPGKLTFDEYFEHKEPVWKHRNEYSEQKYLEIVAPKFRVDAKDWSKEKFKQFQDSITKEVYLLRYGNINTIEEANRRLEAMRQSYEQLSDELHQRYEDEKTEWINDFAVEILYLWIRNEKWKAKMAFDFSRNYFWEGVLRETEGLEIWRYPEVKKEDYTKIQRQKALDELNNTNFASLPADVKNYVAESRAKQAEDYCRKVEAKLRAQLPKLKKTNEHSEFDRNMRYTVRMLCQNPQPTWEDLAEVMLKDEGIKNYVKDPKKGKVLKDAIHRVRESSVRPTLKLLGLSTELVFGKRGRPSNKPS